MGAMSAGVRSFVFGGSAPVARASSFAADARGEQLRQRAQPEQIAVLAETQHRALAHARGQRAVPELLARVDVRKMNLHAWQSDTRNRVAQRDRGVGEPA